MKTAKKLLALLVAAVMLAAILPTALAASTAYVLTIENKDTAPGYEYVAYQIFKGTLSGGGSEPLKLSDIEWGNGITDGGKAALATYAEVATTPAEASAVANGLAGKSAEEIAQIVKAYLGTEAGKDNDAPYEFSFTEPGYYYVQNTKVPSGANDVNKAFSDCIVQVVGPVSVAPKAVFPTVDKLVWDEEADAETGSTKGWGETADHAINESFQFKLVAHIPDDAKIDNYEKYKLVFTDTMSDGVTFDSIASVKIGDADVPTGKYVSTATAGQAGLTWTLTIEDAKTAITGVDIKGKDVVVIYKAHLNKDALTVNPSNPAAASTDANTNKVGLQYSNNPHVNANGSQDMGKTAEDTVFVFTYNVPNFKYYMNANNTETPLPGAGFKLYADQACGTEIPMTKVEDGVFVPAAAGATGTEMNPDSTGNFTIKGLDIGTYYLKETTTPAGFNSCEVMKITVSASPNHAEASDHASASVTYTMGVDGVETNLNKILNQAGATLPTTGGIGTTLFYVIGSILVIGAVVLLVSKKRMSTAD